jgi:hypothetical protein
VDGSVVFAGEPNDPWSSGIAARLGPATVRLERDGLEPGPLRNLLSRARLLVLHAPAPTARDLELVAHARAAGNSRIVFCSGMTARYHQLEPLSALCDVMIPETTAVAAIDRQAAIATGASCGEPLLMPCSVAVVSTNFEMRTMLADALARGGFVARPVRDFRDAPPGQLALWDVPVLEADWRGRLAHETKIRAVIALAGFLDRALVGQMLGCKARCCLDLPCDPADLRWVLRRELPIEQRARA